MKNKQNRSRQGFTLIELLIVIAIIAVLASLTAPALNNVKAKGDMVKDVNNLKNIALACRNYSSDWDGLYPTFDLDEGDGEAAEGETSFGTSTDAFQQLMPEYIDVETAFWSRTKDPERRRPPKIDGELLPEECVYGYAAGQDDSSFSNSPLAFNGLMDGAGVMGEFHPWLKLRKCVVAYVDGHVETNTLSGSAPGSTVKSKDGSIENIFEEMERDDEGKISGGFLDTKSGNVLFP